MFSAYFFSKHIKYFYVQNKSINQLLFMTYANVYLTAEHPDMHSVPMHSGFLQQDTSMMRQRNMKVLWCVTKFEKLLFSQLRKRSPSLLFSSYFGVFLRTLERLMRYLACKLLSPVSMSMSSTQNDTTEHSLS